MNDMYDNSIPGQTCFTATVTAAGSVSYTASTCHNEVGFVCQRHIGELQCVHYFQWSLLTQKPRVCMCVCLCVCVRERAQ